MDKLRVGGPCVAKPRGGKERRGAAGEEYAPNMMHVLDSTGYRACCAVHTVSPAPFIPGDVVEHRLHPEYGRGLIGANDGHGACDVYWQALGLMVNNDSNLTLILPAQPAKEVL